MISPRTFDSHGRSIYNFNISFQRLPKSLLRILFIPFKSLFKKKNNITEFSPRNDLHLNSKTNKILSNTTSEVTLFPSILISWTTPA